MLADRRRAVIATVRELSDEIIANRRNYCDLELTAYELMMHGEKHIAMGLPKIAIYKLFHFLLSS